MAPAEGQLHRVVPGQHLVAAVAVDLQDAGEAVEVSDRLLGLAVGGVDVGHAERIAAAPRTIVAGIGKELPGLGPATPRIEHRCRRLVSEQLGRRLQPGEQPLVHRAQQEGRSPHPVGQGRAIERDALAGIDLSLPV